jgi:hypothetical protein
MGQGPNSTHELVEGSKRTPSKGDRIELLLPGMGVPLRGTLFYVDELQVLVKWDTTRRDHQRDPGQSRRSRHELALATDIRFANRERGILGATL